MAQTTIGQHRCKLGEHDDRPFVVEWDATDLASFESKARRDVVLVKVDGCNLKVLDCRDEGIPGRYGTYGAPTWTSGSVEGFDIRNEGDLYARLPLGAATLSSQVQAGQALHLRYFVSGTTIATRNAVWRSDVAKNPLCASATHFVASFDLGAFEVTDASHEHEAAGVGVGGAGAGGSRSSDSSRLRQAGDLASCTADGARDLSRCKVPIRLALRPVSEGDAPSAPADDATANALATRDRMEALVDSATTKMKGHDGDGCLGDLDRAAQLDAQKDAEPKRQGLRARCEMLAGRCDDGRRRFRTAQAQAEPGWSDADVDGATSSVAEEFCPDGPLTPIERAHRASTRIREARSDARDPTKRDAAVKTCAAEGQALLDLVPRLPKERTRLRTYPLLTIGTAAECIGALADDCSEGKRLWDAAQREGAGLAPFFCHAEAERQHQADDARRSAEQDLQKAFTERSLALDKLFGDCCGACGNTRCAPNQLTPDSVRACYYRCDGRRQAWQAHVVALEKQLSDCCKACGNHPSCPVGAAMQPEILACTNACTAKLQKARLDAARERPPF